MRSFKRSGSRIVFTILEGRKGKSFAECQALVSDAWQDERGFGEGQDPAYQRLWDFPADAGTQFANIAQQVYGPLQACMEKAK